MKRTVDDLAIFGGSPAFPEKLHVGRPNVGDEEALRRRFDQVLANRWFTNGGPFVAEFEARLAELCAVRHAIAVCNATVALEIVAKALDLRGEVILPSFTFVATAHALQWQGITPVFCDVDPSTHNIDPGRVEALITPRTTGIVGVHLWGRPCDVPALQEIATRRGLALFFDAAHAIGCSLGGRKIGSFGAAEVLSFHATKVVNSFEGGAILTNDDDLARKIRLMKNFGFSGYDEVAQLGINGKMPEVCAVMGLTSLESLGRFIEINREIYRTYCESLSGVPGLRIAGFDPANTPNYSYVVSEVDEATVGLDRDAICSILHAENVLARRYFYPGCHRTEPYRSLPPHAASELGETERLCREVLVLPTGMAAQAHVAAIGRLIEFLVENAGTVAARLQNSGPLLA